MVHKVSRAAQAREESRYSMDPGRRRGRTVHAGRIRPLRVPWGGRVAGPGFSILSAQQPGSLTEGSSAVGGSGVQSRGYGWKAA